MKSFTPMPERIQRYKLNIEAGAEALVKFLTSDETKKQFDDFAANDDLRLQFGPVPVIYADSGGSPAKAVALEQVVVEDGARVVRKNAASDVMAFKETNAGEVEGNTLSNVAAGWRDGITAKDQVLAIDRYFKDGLQAALNLIPEPRRAKTAEDREEAEVAHAARLEIIKRAKAMLQADHATPGGQALLDQLQNHEAGASVKVTYKPPGKERNNRYNLGFADADARLDYLREVVNEKRKALPNGVTPEEFLADLTPAKLGHDDAHETAVLKAHFEQFGMKYEGDFTLPPRIGAPGASTGAGRY